MSEYKCPKCGGYDCEWYDYYSSICHSCKYIGDDEEFEPPKEQLK